MAGALIILLLLQFTRNVKISTRIAYWFWGFTQYIYSGSNQSILSIITRSVPDELNVPSDANLFVDSNLPDDASVPIENDDVDNVEHTASESLELRLKESPENSDGSPVRSGGKKGRTEGSTWDRISGEALVFV
ncbi:hypothetical protein ACET3Z_028294 [Daucus carota]